MAVSLLLLKIDGAPGDVTIGNFKDHIALESFSWSLDAKVQDSEPKGATGTKGKIHQLDAKAVNIKKQFDGASTVLHKMMKDDKPFSATLRFIDPANRGSRTSSGNVEIDTVLEIALEGCRIDKIALTANDSGKSISLTESLVISFAKKATLNYRAVNPVTRLRGNASTADIPVDPAAQKD